MPEAISLLTRLTRTLLVARGESDKQLQNDPFHFCDPSANSRLVSESPLRLSNQYVPITPSVKDPMLLLLDASSILLDTGIFGWVKDINMDWRNSCECQWSYLKGIFCSSGIGNEITESLLARFSWTYCPIEYVRSSWMTGLPPQRTLNSVLRMNLI